MFRSTTSAWLEVDTTRRPSTSVSVRRAEGRVEAAQVGDGVADEVLGAVDVVFGGVATAARVGHCEIRPGGLVLRDQLQQRIRHVDDAQAAHVFGRDAGRSGSPR